MIRVSKKSKDDEREENEVLNVGVLRTIIQGSYTVLHNLDGNYDVMLQL